MPKYPSQDFTELIPKEFIYSIVTRKCAVVGNDHGWRNDLNKSFRAREVVHNIFI